MRPIKSLCTLMLLSAVTGCAWMDRNSYREPTSGDVGLITISNVTDQHRANVWIYSNPAAEGNGKAISVFDARPTHTVRALHQPTIVLSLNLIHTSGAVGLVTSSQCNGVYALPFSTGDVRVTLDVVGKSCLFGFEKRLEGGAWKILKEAEPYKGPLADPH